MSSLISYPQTQQVDVNLKITFEADTSLNDDHLRLAIEEHLQKLIGFNHDQTIDALNIKIKRIKEEAEIYGNDQ